MATGSRYILESRVYPHDWTNRRKVRRARMLAEVAKFALWGKVRLRNRGTNFGPWIVATEGIRRIRRRTAFNENGYKIFIQRASDDRTLSIHKVEYNPPTIQPDFGANDKIEQAYGALIRKFGRDGIANGGVYYCRNIDGTNLRSRHGYVGPGWKGAACDIFADPDNMNELAQRAYFLVAETKAGRLHLDRIIVGSSVWESYDKSWHHYSGAYHRHVHFEVHDGWAC